MAGTSDIFAKKGRANGFWFGQTPKRHVDNPRWQGSRLSRPPLANLFSIHDDDPRMLADIESRLLFHKEFDQVWRPDPSWVAAVKYLPRSEPDPAPLRAAGLAFAEGRDAVFAAATDLNTKVQKVVDLVDHHPDRLDSLPGDARLHPIPPAWASDDRALLRRPRPFLC